IDEYVRNDMDLMPQMIERQNGLIKHQNGIVHAEIIDARLWNIFDGSNHLVAEIPDRSAGEWRQVGQLHGFETLHRRAQILNEVRGFAITASRYQKGIDAEE